MRFKDSRLANRFIYELGWHCLGMHVPTSSQPTSAKVGCLPLGKLRQVLWLRCLAATFKLRSFQGPEVQRCGCTLCVCATSENPTYQVRDIALTGRTNTGSVQGSHAPYGSQLPSTPSRFPLTYYSTLLHVSKHAQYMRRPQEQQVAFVKLSLGSRPGL